MADRDDQRKKKRSEDADCKDPTSLPTPKDPPLRPSKDCDPSTTRPENDEFVDPNTCPPPVEEALVVPDPLVVGNDEQTATCPTADQPGDVGNPVTVAADVFTDFFNFGSIPDINNNQLTFLSNLSTIDRNTLADPTTTVAAIESITRLSAAQAAFINVQVTALKANVNTIALTSAETQIACVFENTIQSVTCEDGGFPANAYTNITAPVGEESNVNNPSVVTAGQHTSDVSQAEADAVAQSVAISELRCYYGNEEVTVTCLDVGYTEEVPNDVIVISSDDRLRIGSVTIAADTVFSGIDKDTATALASTIAQNTLECFYINDEITTSCDIIGKTGTVAPAANVEGGVSGNPVTVPEGFIQSPLSTEDANAEASALASSLLECYWTNEEQCKSCPSVDVINPDDPDGPAITIQPQIPGPVCQAAGTVRSYVSQEDADDQAQLFADTQLICTYCNPEIEPKCVPDSYAGGVPVDIADVDETWSETATRGVAANNFCSTNAQDVFNVANSIANTPANVGSAADCCYGNIEVTASCPFGVDSLKSSAPVTIPQDTIVICDSDAAAAGWAGTTQEYATYLATELAEAALLCVWTNSEQQVACEPAECDLFAEGAVATYTVAAGTITSFTSQAEADELAETIGQANLVCIYASKCVYLAVETVALSQPGGDPPTDEQSAILGGLIQDFLLEAQQNGEYVSNSDYNQFLVDNAGAAGLVTTVTSTGAEACGADPLDPGTCVEGVEDPCTYASNGPAKLDEGSNESSISVDAATSLAAVTLRGAQVCVPPPNSGGGGDGGGADGADGTDGSPGNDGAQTNCNGTCYGFYS